MSTKALLGMGRWTIPIPDILWRKQVQSAARKAEAGLRFMTEEDHRVRDVVVRELPRASEPLTPQRIAEAVQLPVDRVTAILATLESRLIFLFRNEQGAVSWAYPVTVDTTPHRAIFSSGETVSAA